MVYRNARSTKSWFLLDDEIVVLAAGVRDPAGRAVTTTVDARIAAPSDQVTLTGRRRDGRSWSGTGTADLSWLRYANGTQGTALGYQFLSGPPVTVGLETVTRSRRVVRTANPDTPVTKQVLGVGSTTGPEPGRARTGLRPAAERHRAPAPRTARRDSAGQHHADAGRPARPARPDPGQHLRSRPAPRRRPARRRPGLGDRPAPATAGPPSPSPTRR